MLKLKHVLILVPAALILILLQSVFWVPGYDSQTKGNPARLVQFVEASIGDAKILNPILHADVSSARIVDLVFDGLLGLDENLELRGRLARDWTVTEEILIPVYRDEFFPDSAPVTSAGLVKRLRAAFHDGPFASLRSELAGIRAIRNFEIERQLTLPVDGADPISVFVAMRFPEIVRVDLNRVDEDFLDTLRSVVGPDYGRSGPPRDWMSTSDDSLGESELQMIVDMQPVVYERPIVTFHLLRGVRFHDGHELDAGDVLFTYSAIMEPRNLSPRTSDFEPIELVEIVDRYTVRVRYKRLFSPAINAWTIGVLPEHLLNDDRLREEIERRKLSAEARATFGLRDSDYNRHPIGTGAFEFRSWESDELIELVRNDAYWDIVPQYQRYFFRVLPDPLAQEMEFRAGAVDIYAPQPHQTARFRESDQYQAFSSLGTGYTYIGYNNRKPMFADHRVRRALGLAIDIDAIIDFVLNGEGERITGPYPKNTPWYDETVASLPYDPSAAEAILNELGWRRNSEGWLEKDGQAFEFNLITNNGNPVRKAVMTIAQNAWRQIGVKVNTQVFEWAVFLEDFINPAEFDAVILGWRMGADPDLYQIWHSSQTGFAQLNAIGFRDTHADELIVRIRRTYDAERQRQYAHRLHARIADQQPYTFLYTRLVTQVLNDRIVMVQDDGSVAPIEPVWSGDLFYHFNRWRKLAPDLAL